MATFGTMKWILVSILSEFDELFVLVFLGDSNFF
jgi:hypothetical protein